MITIEDIRKTSPCYDPTEYLPEDWSGTLIDILDVEDCPTEDRIWVVTQLLDDKTNRLFAVWCARAALKLVTGPDPRSIEACDVAERFANGEATNIELEAVWADASLAAAVADADYWTAPDPTPGAARAARFAAWAAADSAYAYATVAAAGAAGAAGAVGAVTRKSQLQKLREMITEKES